MSFKRFEVVKVNENSQYVPQVIYQLEIRYREVGRSVPYKALFECIPSIEEVAAMIQHVGDSMEAATFDSLVNLDSEALDTMRDTALSYKRLAERIRTAVQWPGCVYKIGHACVPLTNDVGNPVGSITLMATSVWGLRNA